MSKEMREQIDRVRNWKPILNESSDDYEKKLFRRISDAPDKITIEITESGKNLMRKVFAEILKKSQPDYYEKNNPNWFPSYTLDLVDKITLQKKYEPEIKRTEKPNKIGSMKIDQDRGVPDEKRWITLSPMFKNSDGISSDTINMYALYLPFVDNLEGYTTNEKAAMILINAGVEFNNSRQIGNFTPLDKGADYFDKFEVGQVSDKGYFKIVAVN